jgi:UrcA family protein
VVRPDGLDLATFEGQKRLQHRIASAARRICVTNTRDLGLRLKEQQCYQYALKSAEVQMASLVEKAVRAKI